ncbi:MULTISPECIES: hypothetical protein [unclassified Mycobacterium]|uniref:hypothetical protein n=1 Tax=unclassified Mycobacterium TaxID=2642494 RepID=UPI0029C8C68C|nr:MULTISPECIES: hypothetical protein [unclassified Mycobacterium]
MSVSLVDPAVASAPAVMSAVAVEVLLAVDVAEPDVLVLLVVDAAADSFDVLSVELLVDPVVVVADTEVAPLVVLVLLGELVDAVFALAEAAEGLLFVLSVSVLFLVESLDSVLVLAGSEVLPLLVAPSLESACATPAPLTSAAPTPSVTAPAPSQIRTRGSLPELRRRRAVARACSALARFRIRCGLINDLQCVANIAIDTRNGCRRCAGSSP